MGKSCRRLGNCDPRGGLVVGHTGWVGFWLAGDTFILHILLGIYGVKRDLKELSVNTCQRDGLTSFCTGCQVAGAQSTTERLLPL